MTPAGVHRGRTGGVLGDPLPGHSVRSMNLELDPVFAKSAAVTPSETAVTPTAASTVAGRVELDPVFAKSVTVTPTETAVSAHRSADRGWPGGA